MQSTEEHELRRKAWQEELDRKLDRYFGKDIFINLAEGRIGSLTDLKKMLVKYDVEPPKTNEFDSVILLLRQACLDYECMVNNGGNPPDPGIFTFKYPLYIGFGNRDSRKHGLIQILV